MCLLKGKQLTRLSYTTIKKSHFRNIGKAGQFSDQNLLDDFQFNLGTRYQTIFGTLAEYINQDSLTASTVASQQYYYYPVGTQSIDSCYITIGSVNYTLTPVYEQSTWNRLNALAIQPSAIPQFFFPRRNDFGIWPIPQAVYTINFQRFYRDRNLLVDDYTSGTIALTYGSPTVTGTATTFTAGMVGRWLTVTDTSASGEGYYYRIASYTSATVITLETSWAGTTASGKTYLIGETPEIPEEGHILLPMGTASDYYSGLRNDATNAIRFDNAFWTGSYNNNSRDMGDKNIKSGLIGLLNKYQGRDRDNLISKGPRLLSPAYKVWSYSITDSS